MIFIVVKFTTKPDWTDRWPDHVAEFTAATRAEEGCLWFEWSKSLEEPNTYVLVEAFEDDAAEAHVTSAHFQKAQAELPDFEKITKESGGQTVTVTIHFADDEGKESTYAEIDIWVTAKK